MTKLSKGQKAPEFSTVNQRNEVISSKEWYDKKVVLYFYPKDDTPGCTAEACSLRDNFDLLKSKGYTIYGISPDGVKKHVKFIEKFDLPFDLLADEDHSVAMLFGTWIEKSMYGRKYMGMARITFIIENGIISDLIEKVDTKNHAQQVLEIF